MFSTAESIVRQGEIDSNQLLWMDIQQGSFGPDGDLYSRKGLGMTLLVLPFVWLAQSLSALGLVQVALLLNPLLTAWTAIWVYGSGCRLGWERTVSLSLALIFGLATLAWPYTQTFFSDPVSGWGLFGAFYALLSYQQSSRKGYLMLGGTAWGLAYLSRTINLLTLPIFLIGLLTILYNQANAKSFETKKSRHKKSPALSLSSLRTLVIENWRPLTNFLIPVAIAGLLSLWWNWTRYGSIWDSGYVDAEQFSAIWWRGISGLLIGPARGLLWYSPILLLAIPGALWFWRHQRWIFGLSVAIIALYVLTYGKWFMWHGGFSWGPRFLVPLMPFLVLLMGPAWRRLVHQKQWGRLGALGGILLALVSISIQWLGMSVPFGLVQNWLVDVAGLFAPETFTQWQYSPLRVQWQFLTTEQIHFAWWQVNGQSGGVDWVGLLIPFGLICLGLILLGRYMWLNRLHGVDEGQPAQGQEVNYLNGLYGITVCLVAVALLAHYQDRQSTTLRSQIVAQIQSLEKAGDAILHLRPDETQQFANLYHGHLPTYGLFPQEELDPKSEQWLNHLKARYTRLWVIPDQMPPQFSGWERSLRADDFLLFDSEYPTQQAPDEQAPDAQAPDIERQRLSLYAFSGGYPLTEIGLGTIFGDPSDVASGIDDENGWIRLAGYAITQDAHPSGEILVSLRWQSLQSVTKDYHVFVHLLNEQNEKKAQRDGQPVQWMRPTSTWVAGEEIIDQYALLLPEDFPSGTYHVAVGLYDPENGKRLPLSAGTKDYATELGPIEVK